MVILITGASHTGKTLLAQKLLERYHYPYLSIDLLKMGLIRSGATRLTPLDDGALEDYLWPIVREIMKTAIENQQSLLIEGCYIPFHWQAGLEDRYLRHIRYLCLVMSRQYIQQHFQEIRQYANVIEQRIDDSACTLAAVLADNARYLEQCQAHGLPYYLIDSRYPADIADSAWNFADSL